MAMGATTRMAAAALVLAALVLPRGSLARKLTDEEVERLEAGKVIMLPFDKKKYLGGHSYILLDEKLSKSWKAIQDARVYEEIYPTTKESKVVEQGENSSVVKMVQKQGAYKITYYLDYTSDPKIHKLSWDLNKDKPHDINHSSGHFKFSKYKDGRTLMKMYTKLDLGSKFIKTFFGKRIAAGLLRLPKKFRKFLAKPEADKYG